MQQARVLVVDDDEATRQLHATVLGRAGYSVCVAEDGEQAWEILNAGPVDLVVTDEQMPRLRGLELVRRLRQHGSQVPAILASGAAGLELTDPNLDLGLSAVLHKPFLAGDLLAAVRRAVAP